MSENGLIIDFAPTGRNGTGTVTAKLNGDVLAVESLNVTKSKARATFAEVVCNDRPGIDKAAVEAELLKLAADVATKGDKPEDDPQPEPDRLAAMPEAVRAEARAMLNDPQLVKRIVDDIGRLGVAGEKELATTLYLVGTSRLLLRPLAAIVQGPSSSGKSYVIEKTAELFPAEAVVHATQMTPQALFHMEPGSLKNRFVVAGERSRKENDDTAEASRALREMISSGRLVKLMPMKVGGEIQTVSIEQEGPIAYVESTTLSRIFDEDANRCVLLTTDERQEQTRKIIRTLAASHSGSAAGGAADIIERHHAVQRMLQPSTVIVPYADRLGEMVADDRVEARRAFPQLLSMVQASALLHQFQRQVDSDGRLIATTDDYQLARHLLAAPLGRLLGGRLSDPIQRFWERLCSWVAVGGAFTVRDATRRESSFSARSVAGWIEALHDHRYLELAEESRGNRPAVYERSADADGLEGAAPLPTVEKLFPELDCKCASNT